MTAVPLLSDCRSLLKKLQLTKGELDTLLEHTELLAEYASTIMPAHDRALTTAYAIETLGRVFVILDTLHCAVGERPPARLVVGLKSALFLSPKSSEFRNPRVRMDSCQWTECDPMGAGSHVEDASSHQMHSNLHSDVPVEEGSRHHEEYLQNIFKPRTATRTSRALPLHAVFAAVLAVIFLAYLCSQSTEKKTTFSLLSRRLANDPVDEGRDGLDKCTPGPLQTEPEPEGPTTSEYTVPYHGIPGAVAPEVGIANTQTGAKRRAGPENQAKGGTKRLRLETPLEANPLRVPSPLDPAIDALIDSVLLGMGGALSEDVWALDDSTSSPPKESSIGLMPRKGPCGYNGGQFSGTTGSLPSSSTSTFDRPHGVGSLSAEVGSALALSADVDRSQEHHPQLQALLRTPTDQTPAPFYLDVTTSSDYRSRLSSSGTSTAARPLHYETTGAAPSETEDRSEEPESFSAPCADDEGSIYGNQIANMYNALSDEVLQSHPFYRHGGNQGRLSTKAFRLSVATSFRQVRKMPITVMVECKNMLKKPSLTAKEFERFVANTERLFGFATGCMEVDAAFRAMKAISILGQIFLVIDMLYCATEVLGDNSRKHMWWPELMKRIEGARYHHSPHGYTAEKLRWLVDIALELDAVLDIYRSGIRPPARRVVSLKERLLCNPVLKRFQYVSFDPWRADVKEWRQSIKFIPPPGMIQTDSSTGCS
ncbi:hypothetical protein, conserved [Eimeria brunetti]|uniref:Uncharacterized protein n=1 Tax=Eimeria brunetti TaxID=51314 RepID=U6L9Y6_9EIME|nr:hypothetical protein, conserved [Eimeria brunetti]